MLDLDTRFLGAVPTPGVLNITRPFSTVSWSRDNQVALITDGGGVFVVDFNHKHGELETESGSFIGNETRIQCVKTKDEKSLECYTGISLKNLLKIKNRNEIFEIVRDAIICPKELVNAEVPLFFRKVGWSERPLKLKPTNEGKFQYILAALDSHYCLRLYIKSPSLEEMEQEPGLTNNEEWKLCVDFTESYRHMLLSQFWTVDVESNDSSLFTEYKRRMYELATVDFLWLPSWENVRKYNQSSEGDLLTTLVTAHASGDICIWNVCINYATGYHDMEQNEANKYEPNFYMALEFRRNLFPGEIISSMNFYKISDLVGLLVIGTTEGTTKVFRVSYNRLAGEALKPPPEDEGPPPQKFTLDNGTILCEKDGIEVQTTCGVVVPKDESGVGRLLLFVFRHPNFMMPFEIAIDCNLEDGGVVIEQAQSPERIVQGILVGVLVVTQDNTADGIILMTLTQRGMLSWVDIQHGQVKQISSMDLGQLENTGPKEQSESDVEETPATGTKRRLQFGGLTVSPNEAMICVSKTLAEYYNHLALRTPSVLQFHSMLPTTGVWTFLYEKCVVNDFIFHTMMDVLAAFRVIMSSSENLLTEILDWAVPLGEKSLNELQLLLWILRLQPKVDRDQLAFAFNLRNEQPEPYRELKSKETVMARREALVTDHIIQLRCWELINRIVETPQAYNLEGNVVNLQSLMLMYDYLQTKPKFLASRGALPLKPRVLVDPPPRKPACPLCGKPTKLLSSPPEDRWKFQEDFTVEHPIDIEELEGVLWFEHTHVQKGRSHPITSCTLSLVPTAFPYRECNFCGSICMLHPPFNEEPLCPFCNGIMDPPAGFYADEDDTLLQDDEANNAELQRLLKEMEEQKEEELQRKQREAPKSRRARIENMYIDA